MPSPRLTPLTENVAVWPRLGILRSVISACPSPSPTAQSTGGPALIHVSARRGAAPGGRGMRGAGPARKGQARQRPGRRRAAAPPRPGTARRADPALVHARRAHAHLPGHRAGAVRAHRADRGRRAVAGSALGRVLRDGGHLRLPAVRDLRPDREGHLAAGRGCWSTCCWSGTWSGVSGCSACAAASGPTRRGCAPNPSSRWSRPRSPRQRRITLVRRRGSAAPRAPAGGRRRPGTGRAWRRSS